MNLLRSKFFLSFALAAMAGLLAWLYLNHREAQLLRRGKMQRVISARRPISAYTRLRARDLAWREIPAEYVVKGYISSEKDALGQLTLVAFNSDEPLTYNKLSTANASLSHSVPEGLRAISIPVNRVSGIAGMIRPGDLVDVLYLDGQKNSSASVAMLFQGVKVLAAGDFFSEHQEKSDSGGSVTLALSPEDSQLAMLAFSQGALQLSLRSIGDTRLHPSRPVKAGAISDRLGRPVEIKSDDLEAIPLDFIPQKR